MAALVPSSEITLARARAGLIEHPDGVYLDMTHEVYRKDPALGSGSIKQLSHSPVVWWWNSPYNTIEPPPLTAEDAKHFWLGTATHVAFLEGTSGRLDTYEAVYGVRPDAETHPQALDTIRQMEAWLAGKFLPTGGVDKAARIKRILEADPHFPVLLKLQEAFDRSGLKPITYSQDRRIRLLHHLVMMSPEDIVLPFGEVTTLREAFIGGLSEVSVFWTDADGIRQKARFDKLKPRVTLDLKTFSSWKRDDDFDKGLLREVKFRRYPMQAAHYEEGRERMNALVGEGKVFGGSPADHAMLDEIAMSEAWAWVWVFCITQGAPMAKGIRPDMQGIQMQKGVQDRKDALTNFLYYRELFGLEPGQIWIDPVAMWAPEEEDWPF